MIKLNKRYIGWFIISIILIIGNALTTIFPEWLYKDKYSSCYIMVFLFSIFYKGFLCMGIEELYTNFKNIKNFRENILINRYHEYESNNINIEYEHKWLKIYIITILSVILIHCGAMIALYIIYDPISLIVLICIMVLNTLFVLIQIVELAYVCSEFSSCKKLDKIYGLIISGDLTTEEEIRKVIVENVE